MKLLACLSLMLAMLSVAYGEDSPDKLPAAMLDKAEAILRDAPVFVTASSGWGQTTEEGWAFTAILKFSGDPETRFLRLLDRASPVTVLYCLLGLREIKSKRYDELRLQLIKNLGENGDAVFDNRHSDSVHRGESLQTTLDRFKDISAEQYIIEPLPDFFQTKRTPRADP